MTHQRVGSQCWSKKTKENASETKASLEAKMSMSGISVKCLILQSCQSAFLVLHCHHPLSSFSLFSFPLFGGQKTLLNAVCKANISRCSFQKRICLKLWESPWMVNHRFPYRIAITSGGILPDIPKYIQLPLCRGSPFLAEWQARLICWRRSCRGVECLGSWERTDQFQPRGFRMEDVDVLKCKAMKHLHDKQMLS